MGPARETVLHLPLAQGDHMCRSRRRHDFTAGGDVGFRETRKSAHRLDEPPAGSLGPAPGAESTVKLNRPGPEAEAIHRYRSEFVILRQGLM